MNILVTGGDGQLASCIKREIAMYKNNEGNYRNDVYTFCNHNVYDITSDDIVQEKFLIEHNIDVIVNCAAYTNVDKAQNDRDNAYMINEYGVKQLAKICKNLNIQLIHISTDYVFNGEKNIPYSTEDITCPIGVYGRSKDMGEFEIQKSDCKYTIIRTSWLYSNYGKNFYKTMKNLIGAKEIIKVVDDQIGSPTCALDLAEFIINFIADRKWELGNNIYHFSNEGICSWYDFAIAIQELLEDDKSKIIPCFSDEFPSPVKRPHYSVLSKRKITETLGYNVKHWYDALKLCYADKD